MLESAIVMAQRAGADVIVLAAELEAEASFLRDALGPRCRVLAASVGGNGYRRRELDVLALPELRLRRRGRAKIALLEGLAAGLIRRDEIVVVVSGDVIGDRCELDTVAVVDLAAETGLDDWESEAPLDALAQLTDPAAFDALLGLCIELGRGGHGTGLLATLGDHTAVLARSRPIVLNPFEGHPPERRVIFDPEARRAVLEFSGVDGAFVLADDGTILAAGRYLQELAPGYALPEGLGARHRAAAGITAVTDCVAFAVSADTGDTRVFGAGRVIMTVERTD